MKFALALCPALLLAAPALASPGDAPYRAAGTEPGWMLTIDHGLIRYVGDYGRTRVTTAAPEARPSFNGRRFVTPRITIDITRGECSDGMSDRTYPERVMVTVGRRTVRGCGGTPVTAPVSIPVLDGKWRIETFGGHAFTSGRPATISFAGERINGNSGCNAFSGGFRLERGVLTAGPMISTKMACPGMPMVQERAIFALLAQPLTITAGREGRLILSAGGARAMILSRERGFPEGS